MRAAACFNMASTCKAVVTLLFLCLAHGQISSTEAGLTDDVQAAFEEIIPKSINMHSPSDSLVDRILAGFKDLAKLSEDLRKLAHQIDEASAFAYGNILCPQLFTLSGKVDEVTFEISDSTHADASPFGNSDAKLVVESLTTVVKTQKELLNELVAKHEVSSLSDFFVIIRESLSVLQESVESLANALIDLIPSQKEDAQDQFKSLDGAISSAILTYYQNDHLHHRAL